MAKMVRTGKSEQLPPRMVVSQSADERQLSFLD